MDPVSGNCWDAAAPLLAPCAIDLSDTAFVTLDNYARLTVNPGALMPGQTSPPPPAPPWTR